MNNVRHVKQSYRTAEKVNYLFKHAKEALIILSFGLLPK